MNAESDPENVLSDELTIRVKVGDTRIRIM